jgi:hypothetical protein
MAPFDPPEAPPVIEDGEQVPEEAVSAVSAVGAVEAIDQVKALLAVLEPPDRIEISDAFGGTHALRPLLPARRQVRVMRELEALANRTVDRDVVPSFSGGAEGVIGAIVLLAADEEILDGLSSAFALAHPEAMARAASAAEEAGVPEDERTHAADLFPVEEIVSGLVPFFLRLAKRVAEAMGPMTALVGVA